MTKDIHEFHIIINIKMCTVHRKILVGEKLVNLVNRELFTKIFLANIHR